MTLRPPVFKITLVQSQAGSRALHEAVLMALNLFLCLIPNLSSFNFIGLVRKTEVIYFPFSMIRLQAFEVYCLLAKVH